MIIRSNAAGSIIDNRVAQSLQEFTMSKTVEINMAATYILPSETVVPSIFHIRW
jgi:hypothetical protein